MSVIKRIFYFLFGMSIGLIILSFIFSGKKTSCNYGPQARVKSQLLKKEIIIPDSFIKMNISNGAVNDFIRNSSVDFSISNTLKDSCKTYVLNGYLSSKKTSIKFENCNRTVSILEVNP